MSGILSAIKLMEAGHTNLRIYEKADRVGGTWRENTYPGIACDVPSHLYSYSFEPNADWSRAYSPGAEIQAYFERVARDRGIEKLTRFGQEITRCEFIDGFWQLTSTGGEVDAVDVVIAATGVLHHPNYPDIEGLGDFDGPCFHSARWDHDVSLAGKRVGVVGTGSSGVQIAAALVDEVAELSLFQRTPQWVLPQDNTPYSEEQKTEFRQHPETMRELRRELYVSFAQNFANAVVDADSPHMAAIEQACLDNLENSVRDPKLRERLRPNYRAACKRLVISPDFYEAIQKPNAKLVDQGIERVEASGVRTQDGVLHELDVLVLATGFKADRFMRPMHITGCGGVKLDELWAERPVAYLSISIPGMPNFFMLNGPNGPVGNFSLIDVAEHQLSYVLQLVEELRSGRCSQIAASESATRDFDEDRTEAAMRTIWTTGCRSWYLDDRGIPAVWPWTFDRFLDEMAEPRLEAYEQS
jgi:cation diffusion facilitator CzcD-associated flavoprotein CzcO